MLPMRPWALWRRLQYGVGYTVVFGGLFVWLYFAVFYVAPTCLDARHNGDERGVDCGGACARVCAFDVVAPTVTWARSFRVTDGQYNAVAYVENRNPNVATPEFRYTFKLFDEAGLITERAGVTTLPAGTYPIFEGRIDTGERIPRQTIFEFTDPSEWYPSVRGRSAFSTETFELAGVGTAPRLDARLTNNEFTDIDDVAVVATIFDRSGNALTTSQTYIDTFPSRSSRAVTFTWPEPIAGTLRSCDVPTDVVLAIDLSGSMNNDSADPPEPLSGVLTAARNFISRLQARDQVSVVTFATDATLALPLSSDKAAADALVRDLRIDPAEERGATNQGAALEWASEVMRSPARNPDARQVVVLLTDGLATAPDDDPEVFAQTAADNLKAAGAVTLYTIGIGTEVNETFVKTLASTPDDAFFAVSPAQIDAIYRSITGKICEDGPARIDIIPRTSDIFE